MSKTFHTLAGLYTCRGIDYRGISFISTNVIAYDHRTNIHELINSWNLQSDKRTYEFSGHIDVEKAITIKSEKGTCILDNYRLLPDLKYHSVLLIWTDSTVLDLG